MHFPFPSRDDPSSHSTSSKKNNDDYYRKDRNSHLSSSSNDEDDPFTAMRRFVDHQFSSFFGSFSPFASFDEFFNDDRRERILRQQRQCDELRRRIYEEMEGRTGSGNEKLGQGEPRHDQTVLRGDQRGEWARQGITDFNGMSPRTAKDKNLEKAEEDGGRNSWRKWWCDRHSENDYSDDLRRKGPWARQCPKTARYERSERASSSNDAGDDIIGQTDVQGQSSSRPGYVRIIPETLPLFYSRQYLLSNPYSPLYLELDYRFSKVPWRAAYEELLLAVHGAKLSGATHGADSKGTQQEPMRWVQRILGSRMVSKTSNSPLLILKNEHPGGQYNNQKQRQIEIAKQDEGLKLHEQNQQDSQILRALAEAEKKANQGQHQHQRQRQRQRQSQAQYKDFQTDAYENFLNEYNDNSSMAPRHPRDRKTVVNPQKGMKIIDAPPESSNSESSAASTSNPSVTLSRPTNDQSKTPTSLLTTTERRVLPDGTVTTKTTLKRQFADGSEETTENESTSLLGREDKDSKNGTKDNNNNNTTVAAISKSNNNAWKENSEWPNESLAKYGLGSGFGPGSGPWNDSRLSEFGLSHGVDIAFYDDAAVAAAAVERERNNFDEYHSRGQTILDKRGGRTSSLAMRRPLNDVVSSGADRGSNKVNDKKNDDNAERRWTSWFWSNS